MTTNQINYQKHVEERRHNRAVERETKRANLVQAAIQEQSLSESVRHNKAYESIQSKQVGETNRHNVEIEKLGLLNYGLDSSKRDILQQQANIQEGQLGVAKYNAETNRTVASNNYNLGMAQAEISRSNLAETIRHNQAYETTQSQQVSNSYDLGLRNNAANILVHTQQQLLQSSSLKESARHNVVVEDENVRHNKAVESETKRQNTVTNLFKFGDIVSGYVKPALGMSKASR